MQNKSKYKTNYLVYIKKYFVLAIIIMMATITMYFAKNMINRAQTLLVGASAGTAQIFFEPSNVNLTSDAMVNLWVTTDKPLAFARTEFSFDPNILKLTKEITLFNPALKRVIKVSKMSEANTTGKIVIIIGLDPTTLGEAPVGSFKIASLNLAPKVRTSNISTSIDADMNNLQLVDSAATTFSLTSTPLALTYNSLASTTPTVIASPAPSDTIFPTVSISYPRDNAVLPKNSKVTITAKASDNIGVSRVRFFVEDALRCTVTKSPYICELYTGKDPKGYKLRVKAFDNAGNETTSTINIQTK